MEARLARNAGQAAIVTERDAAILAAMREVEIPLRALLDLGCGEGHALAHLCRALSITRGVGVDLLPERIERARRAWPGLEFEVGDGGHLPFADGTFDVVLTMTLMSSVPDKARPRVIAEIARVLRPGGIFVWYDMRRQSPGNPNVHPFSSTDVRRLLPGWSVRRRLVTVAPPIARRLGPATEALYPALAHLSPLLTHEVGVAEHPGTATGPTPAERGRA